MANSKKWVIGIFVIILIVGAFAFSVPQLYQGNLGSIQPISLPPRPSCTSTWSLAFAGSLSADPSARYATDTDYMYRFTVQKPLTYNQLRNLVGEGCSFKVVRTQAAGGWSGRQSFECAMIELFDVDGGGFKCTTSELTTPDGDSSLTYFDSLNLNFAGGNTPHYVRLENQGYPDGAFEVALYMKK